MKNDKKKIQTINSRFFAEVKLNERVSSLFYSKVINIYQYAIMIKMIKTMCEENDGRMLLSHSLFVENNICGKTKFFKEIKNLAELEIIEKEGTLRNNNSTGRNRYVLVQ